MISSNTRIDLRMDFITKSCLAIMILIAYRQKDILRKKYKVSFIVLMKL